jgi:hypothetical protein
MEIAASTIESVYDELKNVTDIWLRTDYSGRGMYGEECFGVEGSTEVLAEFELNLAIACSVEDLDLSSMVDISRLKANHSDIVERRRRDAMGMDTIHYYPRIEVSGHFHEQDEDGNIIWD